MLPSANITSRSNKETRRFFLLEDDESDTERMGVLLCDVAARSLPTIKRVEILHSSHDVPQPSVESALGWPLWLPTTNSKVYLYDYVNNVWQKPRTINAAELGGDYVALIPWHTSRDDDKRFFMPHAILLDILTGNTGVRERDMEAFVQVYSRLQSGRFPSAMVWIFSREAGDNFTYGTFLPKIQALGEEYRREAPGLLIQMLGSVLKHSDPWIYHDNEAKMCINVMRAKRPWLLQSRLVIHISDPDVDWKSLSETWKCQSAPYTLRIGDVPIKCPETFTFFTKALMGDDQWEYLNHKSFGLPYAYLKESLWDMENNKFNTPDVLIKAAWALLKDQQATPLLRLNAAVLLEMIWDTGDPLDWLNHTTPEGKKSRSGEFGHGSLDAVWKEYLCPSQCREAGGKAQSTFRTFRAWFNKIVAPNAPKQNRKTDLWS